MTEIKPAGNSACTLWSGKGGEWSEGNVIGYARVSMADQNLDSQLGALGKAGAARVFSDKLSGSTMARLQFQACLASLDPGNVHAVYSTDRLGRSAGDLTEIVDRLREQGIQLKSLTEPLSTTDHGDELYFHIVVALTRIQRPRISKNTRAGLAAANARGRLGGTPMLMGPDRVELARTARAEGTSFDDTAALLKVGTSSVKRALVGGDRVVP